MSLLTQNLGFPRIGRNRELKKALEGYWNGRLTRPELLAAATALRRENWRLQKAAGIGLIPSNDFSFYDQMLDHVCLLGCAPERYLEKGRVVNLDGYFAMARGGKIIAGSETRQVHALEMTKWLDTNYHFLVPELKAGQDFQLAATKPFDEFREAQSLGIATKPVFLGPVSFLRLAKCQGEPFEKLSLLKKLIPVYVLILKELRALGAEWVQLDEPVLAMDMEDREREALAETYQILAQAAPDLSLMLCSYFGAYGDNLPTLLELPVAAVHLDLFRAEEELDLLAEKLPSSRILSLGVVEGRNIWKNDFSRSLAWIQTAVGKLGPDRVILSPSCSLLHAPISLEAETALPDCLKDGLAFAKEKLTEVAVLARLSGIKNPESDPEYLSNQKSIRQRKDHPGTSVAEVRERLKGIRPGDGERKSPFAERQVLQRKKLRLPLYPTTTIGSFPQTEGVRKARADWKKGRINDTEYRAFLEAETIKAVRLQEEIGLDVLVHGEFERNDMVEFFGEKLKGFAFTSNGWVQSYGSRCVKPPLIHGDVFRAGPMTLDWTVYAARFTEKPMKGMLTGPVTILKWSFVRDDQPLSDTANQIALAIRDEVIDLEAGGVPVIQIDEPALREALPLRQSEWKAVLDWEVRAFKLSASGVQDQTQIHTHMCYCDFGEIMEYIARMDADVISLEASRSRMELLEAFSGFRYPNEIGPGVWDIHSPQIPESAEMMELLKRARAVIGSRNLWVNPDCGLKTRRWEEVIPALKNMVAAAKALRKEG